MILSFGAPPVRSFIRSGWSLFPLAVGYGILLANSWSPDTLSIILPGSLKEGFSGGFNPQVLHTPKQIARSCR